MRSEVEEFFDGNEDHTIVKTTTPNPVTGEKYVIAHSINVQKQIAHNLHLIKWLLAGMIVGGAVAGIFLIGLYLKLDALNFLSLLA